MISSKNARLKKEKKKEEIIPHLNTGKVDLIVIRDHLIISRMFDFNDGISLWMGFPEPPTQLA